MTTSNQSDEALEHGDGGLSWRTGDSGQDWTIVVSNDKDEARKQTGTVYLVHLIVLARRSEYFANVVEKRIAEKEGFVESQRKTIRITLDSLSTQAFPHFLDYMYTPKSTEYSFCTETATALYTLGIYFGVQCLQREAEQYALEDMHSAETCGTYFEHATLLKAKSILEAATKVCHEKILDIDPKHSRLLHVAAPAFWIDVLRIHTENDTISTADVSWQISWHLCHFLSRHGACLDQTTVRQLTTEELLNHRNELHPSFLLLLLVYFGRSRDDESLTDIQSRSVDALIHNKRHIKIDSWFKKNLKKMPPKVFYELTVRGWLGQH